MTRAEITAARALVAANIASLVPTEALLATILKAVLDLEEKRRVDQGDRS